jgi:hypothetical protein
MVFVMFSALSFDFNDINAGIFFYKIISVKPVLRLAIVQAMENWCVMLNTAQTNA